MSTARAAGHLFFRGIFTVCIQNPLDFAAAVGYHNNNHMMGKEAERFMAKRKKFQIGKRTWFIRIVAMGCALLMLATIIIAALFWF